MKGVKEGSWKVAYWQAAQNMIYLVHRGRELYDTARITYENESHTNSVSGFGREFHRGTA